MAPLRREKHRPACGKLLSGPYFTNQKPYFANDIPYIINDKPYITNLSAVHRQSR